MLTPEHTMTVLSTDFLERLIKRCPEADQILQDCGRIRLQRAALAAVEVYEEMLTERPTVGREEE